MSDSVPIETAHEDMIVGAHCSPTTILGLFTRACFSMMPNWTTMESD